jgi:hypothetical protein
VAERKGEREEMQDAHVVIDDFLPEVVHAAVDVYVNVTTLFFASFSLMLNQSMLSY